jgi:tRNA 2-thiouridine synthesizing protein A
VRLSSEADGEEKFNPVWAAASEWIYSRTTCIGGNGLVETDVTVEVDASGQQCPMPLLYAKRALNRMQSGERLRVLATDQGSVRDFRVFAEQSGHTLLASEERAGVYIHLLQKS